MSEAFHRVPWSVDFPDVIVHGELKARNANPAYESAKAGDIQAAGTLVREMFSAEAVETLRRTIGDRHPLVVPVSAIEARGFNAIPDVMAHALAESLSLDLGAVDIVQTNYVGHTRANGWHRIVTPATFDGEVRGGADYLLIDDHVGFGGTLANLRGFIEVNDARVIAMTALTETSGARRIAIRPETLNVLRAKHGEELENFWREVFGHRFECLTDIEGGYLSRVETVAAIRDRMAQAAEEARQLGLPALTLD